MNILLKKRSMACCLSVILDANRCWKGWERSIDRVGGHSSSTAAPGLSRCTETYLSQFRAMPQTCRSRGRLWNAYSLVLTALCAALQEDRHTGLIHVFVVTNRHIHNAIRVRHAPILALILATHYHSTTGFQREREPSRRECRGVSPADCVRFGGLSRRRRGVGIFSAHKGVFQITLVPLIRLEALHHHRCCHLRPAAILDLPLL